MMNVMNLQASAAVTILESTDSDNEATAMSKIANLTVNNLTASFDTDFNDPTANSTIFNSTILDNNRRYTRQQQFYQEAGVIQPSSQQRQFVNIEAIENINAALHVAAEEIVDSQQKTTHLSDQIPVASTSQLPAVSTISNLHLLQNQIIPGPSTSQSQAGVMNVSPPIEIIRTPNIM